MRKWLLLFSALLAVLAGGHAYARGGLTTAAAIPNVTNNAVSCTGTHS